MKKYSLCIAVVLVSMSNSAFSQQSCENYPYTDGINVEDVQGGTKIIATGSASVSFDDIDSIKDAREEAELEAKAAISKFMTEGIKSESTIAKVVNESKSTSGEQSERIRKELITRVKNLGNTSQALLRGAVPLGDCYTKAREVRVSVGMKPETIKAAENLAGSISQSVSSQPTSSAQNAGSNNNSNSGSSTSGAPQPLRGSEGFSNTNRLNKF
jgi:hypothetical protein